MNSRCFSLALCALALLLPAYAGGQEKSIAAVFTEDPPVIDGALDDAAWQNAPLITDFHQLEPEEFGQPTQRTEVRILYDEKYLYVAGRLYYTDMSLLTANIMVPQQRVFRDDRLYIVLDPFQDRRNGYLFEANAHGIQGDALLENNSQRINEWTGVFQAETSIDAAGWSVEFKIPFSTVSFDPQNANWGLNILRDIKATQERLAWSSQGRQEFLSAPSAAGTLVGLQNLKQGLGLDIIPSVSIKSEKDFSLDQEDSTFEPSLDLTYRITPSLTAKLTLNTDFSATEVDDRLINLTRFPLFFPEKRDFFLQDAGIFEFAKLRFNGRPFFSRTIGLSATGDPLNLNAGAKLTGRVGGWNLGFLGIQQESSEILGRRNLFVGRAVANIFEESSIGLIVTDGDPQNERDARTVGVDLRYRNSRLRDNNILQGEVWYQQTNNDGSPGDAGKDDAAWGVRAQLPNDRHNLDAWIYQFGRDFDPAMGFINRAGIRNSQFLYRFRSRPAGGYWQMHDQQIRFRRIESVFNDELTDSTEFVPWMAMSRLSDMFRIVVRREREVLEDGFFLFNRIYVPPGDYEYTRYGAMATTARHRKLQFRVEVETGDFLHGKRKTLSLELRWKPSARFNIAALYSSNDVRLPTGAFTARVMSLKSEIAFSKRWSFIPLAQFDNVSGQLGINLRLRWHLARGSDLFLVWNRNMLRGLDDRFYSTFQESVIKGTYTFRF